MISLNNWVQINRNEMKRVDESVDHVGCASKNMDSARHIFGFIWKPFLIPIFSTSVDSHWSCQAPGCLNLALFLFLSLNLALFLFLTPVSCNGGSQQSTTLVFFS